MDIKLSVQQIKEMMHCCGNDSFRVKDSRNHFNTGEYSQSWEDLLNLNLARSSSKLYVDGTIYHVTEKGFEVLKKIYAELKIEQECGNEDCEKEEPEILHFEVRNGKAMSGFWCSDCTEKVL